jgi:hypothetical protein
VAAPPCAFDAAIIDRRTLAPIPRSIDSSFELPKKVTARRARPDDLLHGQRVAPAAGARNFFASEGTMNEDHRRRRAFAAQGFAAAALFALTHSAHAATVKPAHAQKHVAVAHVHQAR